MITRNSISFNNNDTKLRLGIADGEDAEENRFNENNKLQAYKSSFQAWKCVSFGCSLLAVVMLASKYYEVSTDLNLLLGIERLLQVSLNSSSVGRGALTWPPVPIELILPAANESSLGLESMESNDTMLMSHLQMSLTRELNGDQLLRQEVDAFVVEFKNAKSTLGLSSLLVTVYIISWILMTFAVNDTRISNDITLRNILLLTVFGAVDIAASAGFIMIRLIMYSTKNNSFAIEMLDSVGLRDTSVKLSADQLTAFTALRLIGMRSCSAYVDVYVSVVLVFLTVLRLYAVIRALAYYRLLRRRTVGSFSSGMSINRRPETFKKQQQVWSSFYNSSNAGFFQPQLISHQPLPEHQKQQQQQLLQELGENMPNTEQQIPNGYHGDNQVYLTRYDRSPDNAKLMDNTAPARATEQYTTSAGTQHFKQPGQKVGAQTLTRTISNNEQRQQQQQQPPVMILPQSAYSTFRGAQVYSTRGRSSKSRRQHQSQSNLLLIPDQSAHARLVLSEPECESEPVTHAARARRQEGPTELVDGAIHAGEFRLLAGETGRRQASEVSSRRLVLASEQPIRTRTSGQKYRLVAARLKQLPRVLAGPEDLGVTASNGSTKSHLVGDSGNSSSSSSCNPDDSDGSAAQLRPTMQKQRVISNEAGCLDRLTGLRESEELVSGSLRRHKVYEVLNGANNKRPSSLVSKYYYA